MHLNAVHKISTILFRPQGVYLHKFFQYYFDIVCFRCDCILYTKGRDHFVYVPSQWKMTLQCNVISHWLGTFTKWSIKRVTEDLFPVEVFVLPCPWKVSDKNAAYIRCSVTRVRSLLLVASAGGSFRKGSTLTWRTWTSGMFYERGFLSVGLIQGK